MPIKITNTKKKAPVQKKVVKKPTNKKGPVKKNVVKKTTEKKGPVERKVVKKPTPIQIKKAVTKSKSNQSIRAKPAESTKPQRVIVVDGMKRTTVPLVVEPYPRDYTGLPFLTLIQFRKQPMLVIVDNVDDRQIRAYVLDLCGPEQVDEEMVILAASEWYSASSDKYPVSIEFSRRVMTAETSRIYRTFDVEFVSRVIGPAPQFPMGASAIKSVKRRRRKPVPAGVEINSG
jgi:hypothetical protein